MKINRNTGNTFYAEIPKGNLFAETFKKSESNSAHTCINMAIDISSTGKSCNLSDWINNALGILRRLAEHAMCLWHESAPRQRIDPATMATGQQVEQHVEHGQPGADQQHRLIGAHVGERIGAPGVAHVVRAREALALREWRIGRSVMAEGKHDPIRHQPFAVRELHLGGV